MAIEARQERVSVRYLKGESLREIGKGEGVSHITIMRDLEAVRARWRQNADINFDEYQSRELAKVDLIEAENWEQWERSKQDKEVKAGEERIVDKPAETGEDGKPKPAGKRKSIKTAFRREGQTAATEYMRVIQWCVDKRMQLLGFEPAKKVALTDPTGKKEFAGGGDGRSSPLAAILAGARTALDRIGQGAGEGPGEGGAEQPAAVGPADGATDAGV